MNRKQDDWNPMANACQAQVAIGLSKSYADEIVESLLDYLQRIETIRGAGRLYLP